MEKIFKVGRKIKIFFQCIYFFHTVHICIYKYITAQTTDSSPGLDPAVSPLKLLPFIIYSICNLFTSRSLSCQRSWIFIPSGYDSTQTIWTQTPKPPEGVLRNEGVWPQLLHGNDDVKLENWKTWFGHQNYENPATYTIFSKLVYYQPLNFLGVFRYSYSKQQWVKDLDSANQETAANEVPSW